MDNKYKDNPYMRDYEGTKKLYDSLNVLPVGLCSDGSFYDVGSFASFWSATESNSIGAYGRYFDTSDTMYQNTDSKGDGFSVRLVKD